MFCRFCTCPFHGPLVCRPTPTAGERGLGGGGGGGRRRASGLGGGVVVVVAVVVVAVVVAVVVVVVVVVVAVVVVVLVAVVVVVVVTGMLAWTSTEHSWSARFLLTKKGRISFRVGIFLGFVRRSGTTRTPHGAHVRVAEGNRIDTRWGEYERLAARTRRMYR